MKPRVYVAESMEALSTGLEPFVKSSMVGHFKAGWLGNVRACLPPTWSGVTERQLADPYVTLRVLSKHWWTLFSPPLKKGLIRSVAQLARDRNDWAHFESFSRVEAGAVLDRALILLQAIGAPSADTLARLQREYVRKHGHPGMRAEAGEFPLALQEVAPAKERWQPEVPSMTRVLSAEIPVPRSFSRADLETVGFRGFVRGDQLPQRRGDIPQQPGVYLAMRPAGKAPIFLPENPAGHFKGRDPSMPVAWLEEQWVEGAEVVYIGRTKNLGTRAKQHLRFGQGRAVGAWGGKMHLPACRLGPVGVGVAAPAESGGSSSGRAESAGGLHGPVWSASVCQSADGLKKARGRVHREQELRHAQVPGRKIREAVGRRIMELSPHSKGILATIADDLLSLEAVLGDPIFKSCAEDPERHLELSLLTLAADVFCADGSLHNDEGFILNDIGHTLAGFFFPLQKSMIQDDDVRHTVLPEMRKTFVNLRNKNRDIYEKIIPVWASAFDEYDAVNGTAFGDLLRSTYLRFATACAEYDGPPSANERQVLSKLERTLYPARASGPGEEHEISAMICPQCGALDEGTFCSNCGARLTKEALRSPGPKVVAAPDHDLAGSLCPVCQAGVLRWGRWQAYEGANKLPAFACERCGSSFVDRGGGLESLRLDGTNRPDLPRWKIYQGQTMSGSEWKRLAANDALSPEPMQAVGLMSTSRPEPSPRPVTRSAAPATPSAGPIDRAAEAEAPVLLRPWERVVLCLYGIVLREPKRVSRGLYGGPSFHLGKGVSFRLGAFQAEGHDELDDADQGTLVLTNQRLVFAGELRSMTVELAKVSAVDSDYDSITIHRPGKDRPQSYVGLSRHDAEFEVAGMSHEGALSGDVVRELIETLIRVGR